MDHFGLAEPAHSSVMSQLHAELGSEFNAFRSGRGAACGGLAPAAQKYVMPGPQPAAAADAGQELRSAGVLGGPPLKRRPSVDTASCTALHGAPAARDTAGGVFAVGTAPPPPPFNCRRFPFKCRRFPPTAVGYPPTAVGCPPTAVGYPPTAVGYPPTAVGYPPTAVGYPPTAVGYPPTAVGYPPTAVGYPPTAVGYPPTAVGYPPTAVGYPPTAVGYPPTAPPTAARLLSNRPPTPLSCPPAALQLPVS